MTATWYPFTVLVGALLSLILASAWPVVGAVIASLLALSASARTAWTPSGEFGWANSLTWARVLLCALLFALPAGPGLACLALLILILDAADGALARLHGSTSSYGAALDKECDAFFMLAMCLLVWWQGLAGPWVLIPGLWRYVYGAILVLWPASTIAPRSTWARYVFAAASLCLIASLVPGNRASVWFAAAATVGISASFVRSLYYSFLRN
ncbi:MAG: CDP-alcohol phosphatidyltransferase family protein [Kofleriaceae bacterium]|nr:CDP-alcohol phosphatidyltransferase family protein [Kofleriaceae bacterium]